MVDAEIATAGDWDEAEFEVLLYEFKAGLETYLRDSDASIRTLAALIEFNNAHAARERPDFGQELFLKAQAKGSLTDVGYLAARDKARRVAKDEGIEATLQKQRLDALIAPATGPACSLILSTVTISPAWAMALRRSPARRASPYRWATATACRSACCSWVAHGASRA